MLTRVAFLILAGGALFAEACCPYAKTAAPSLYGVAHAFYYTSEIYNDEAARECEYGDCSKSNNFQLQRHQMCNENIVCDPNYPYRSFDGTCNNLAKPWAGSINQCHQRIIPADYADGVSKPREPVDVVKIYNALQAIPWKDVRILTVLHALFGQFVVHDITATALSELEGSTDCCAKEHANNPVCSMRIDVSNATGYRDFGVKCMSFLRAARCPCSEGTVRESMNGQTMYLDLSHVYGDGSNRDPQRPWRLPESYSNVSGVLPSLDPNPVVCYAKNKKCFKGDNRMNQQQGVSVLHVMFERMHNAAAEEFKRLNPHWSSEQVFQEARKLTIGRYQYVASNEFIFTILVEDLMRERKIHIDQLLEGTEVDPEIETVTLLESVASESRVHLFVPNQYAGKDFMWLDSSKYYTEKGFMNDILNDLMTAPMNAHYPFKKSVGQEVLKAPEDKIGMSMVLLNIQRGRDLGLARYSALIEWAFKRNIRSFEDLVTVGIQSQENMELLRSLYPTVHDIDMWVGASLQNGYQGSSSYPHQLIRLALQYVHIYGDRFFFSHKGVFTPEQRAEIVATSGFGQIACELFDIDEVPKENPFVFYEHVEMVKCSTIKKKFNYTLWKE